MCPASQIAGAVSVSVCIPAALASMLCLSMLRSPTSMHAAGQDSFPRMGPPCSREVRRTADEYTAWYRMSSLYSLCVYR
jgi:hypothetical protein